MRNKRKGFTLAEVLVTLVMVGVVATLTIPSLVGSMNKAQYVSKLKKEFSVLTQAYMLIVADSGGSILNNPNFSSATGDAATDANAMNEFATKLNVVKNCGSATGCWYTSPLKYLGGTTNYSDNLDPSWSGAFGKAILADGTSIMVDISASSCTTNRGAAGTPLANSSCGYIWMDINGAVGPNIFGRDVFSFWITQTGIYPQGIFGDGRFCDINSATSATSSGCTAKVLAEGAMNY